MMPGRMGPRELRWAAAGELAAAGFAEAVADALGLEYREAVRRKRRAERLARRADSLETAEPGARS